MSPTRTVLLTTITMTAFAANSLLCRAALADTAIDAATFTGVRLVSGALTLWLLVGASSGFRTTGGNWASALALFGYAAGFSFAYISLPAGTGALLLFGAVQMTMIGSGLRNGERISRVQVLGLAMAIAGLVGLLLPGLEAPPLLGSLLMLGAGISWGVYSLRGRGEGNPLAMTAGNFMRAVPMCLILSGLYLSHWSIDTRGLILAAASGALASGMGYALWYSVLPQLRATTAATVQLSVPVIAALGAALLLSEPLTMRLMLSSVAILGGIALFIRFRLSTQP